MPLINLLSRSTYLDKFSAFAAITIRTSLQLCMGLAMGSLPMSRI